MSFVAPVADQRLTLNAVVRILELENGPDAETVDAVALNDYRAEIPATDFAAYGPILATRVDGTPLRVRDKGPLWVVYPWSANPQIDNIEFHSRSIWQVKTLVVH